MNGESSFLLLLSIRSVLSCLPSSPLTWSILLCPQIRSRQFWRATFSELLGTLVLVSVVLGASVPGPGEDHIGPLYPAIAVGVAIVALAHCFGEMSGAQVRSKAQSFQ